MCIRTGDLYEKYQEKTCLTFYLANKKYGLDIKYVRQIIDVPNIIHIPELPHYYIGVMYYKDNIVPVLNCRVRLGINNTKPSNNSGIIIIEINNMIIGLLVDLVAEVVPNNEDSTNSHLALANNKFIKDIKKLNNEYFILLNCCTLV